MSGDDSNPPKGFRLIPGFSDYAVSRNGVVLSKRGRNGFPSRSWRNPKIIKPVIRTGYLSVKIVNEQGLRQAFVHVLILETYVGSRPDGCQCRHLDGCRTNNNLSNLCWGTPKENQEDKDLHGTQCRGEKHGRSVLFENDVREIRRRAEAGERHVDIANDFSVSQTRVWSIVNRRSWNHI